MALFDAVALGVTKYYEFGHTLLGYLKSDSDVLTWTY